jgi:hypothetical protein
MPGTKRVPIARHAMPRITPAAVAIFAEIRKHKYPSERWWELHNRLHDELGCKPWEWPCIEHPDSVCCYPEGSPAAQSWRPNEEARALWRQLEAALEPPATDAPA